MPKFPNALKLVNFEWRKNPSFKRIEVFLGMRKTLLDKNQFQSLKIKKVNSEKNFLFKISNK
jgi:hypothetical protein